MLIQILYRRTFPHCVTLNNIIEYMLPLVFDRTIFETEITITENICIQHLTHRKGQKRITAEQLIGVLEPGLAGEVTLCNLFLYISNILFFYQPKCIPQTSLTVTFYCHEIQN